MAGGSCCKKLGAIVGLLKAILSRILFAVHGLICIWRLFVVKQEPLYWCMVLTLLPIILEMVATLRIKGGAEWGWFSPSVFLYLAYTVPPIWLLELDLLMRRIEHRHTKGYLVAKDTPNLAFLPGKIRIPISLDPEKWVRILQQVLLLLLIIGRWLLPKGRISREQLSQLLLIYMGMAADIIELFEAFKETAVMHSWNLTIVILSLWTASLLQFTFVVGTTRAKQTSSANAEEVVDANATRSQNGTRARGRRHAWNGAASDRKTPPTPSHRRRRGRCCCCCCCCTADVVSILTSITLQDGPFLVLRMLLIFRYNVLSYTNIFFTSKNTLVILLQVYRLTVLYCERLNKKKGDGRNGKGDERFQREEAKQKDSGVKRNATENGEAALRQQEQTGHHERKSNVSFCCREKGDVDDWGKDRRYEEEGEEEEEAEEGVVIDNEDLPEELSSASDMFEIVTCPSLKDSKIWESVSSSPSAKTCSLDRPMGRQSEKEKRQIARRNEEDAFVDLEIFQHSRHDRRDRSGVEKLQEMFKSNAEFPPSESKMSPLSHHLQEKHVAWEISQKKNSKTNKEENKKMKKGERFTKTDAEYRQFEQELQPTRQLNKNYESSAKSLRKDPKSKRPKLFQVAVEARMQSERCERELANEEDLQPDFKKIATAKMATGKMAVKCPNCANSKNERQNGHKRKRSPEGFIICRIKEDIDKEFV